MTWLVDLILKLIGTWLNRTPTSVAEAERAGAAEAELKIERDNAVEVERAVTAEAAARAADVDPVSLRHAPDPDCRDCAT
jgi:hypothetical protein